MRPGGGGIPQGRFNTPTHKKSSGAMEPFGQTTWGNNLRAPSPGRTIHVNPRFECVMQSERILTATQNSPRRADNWCQEESKHLQLQPPVVAEPATIAPGFSAYGNEDEESWAAFVSARMCHTMNGEKSHHRVIHTIRTWTPKQHC